MTLKVKMRGFLIGAHNLTLRAGGKPPMGENCLARFRIQDSQIQMNI